MSRPSLLSFGITFWEEIEAEITHLFLADILDSVLGTPWNEHQISYLHFSLLIIYGHQPPPTEDIIQLFHLFVAVEGKFHPGRVFLQHDFSTFCFLTREEHPMLNTKYLELMALVLYVSDDQFSLLYC